MNSPPRSMPAGSKGLKCWWAAMWMPCWRTLPPELRKRVTFTRPTILADIPPGTPADQEEFFGPVALTFRVPDLAAAIALANSPPSGWEPALGPKMPMSAIAWSMSWKQARCLYQWSGEIGSALALWRRQAIGLWPGTRARGHLGLRQSKDHLD
jgi:hypothetical protein